MKYPRSASLSHPRFWISLSLVGILGLLASATHGQGIRLVSYNPHPVTGSTVPMASLADNPYHSANAYHVNTDAEVYNVLHQFPAYGKAKIVSNDDHNFSVGDAMDWLDMVFEEACGVDPDDGCPEATGEVHFEHFDRPLTVRASYGEPIAIKDHFPEDSQTMLDAIKAKKPSVLAPLGKLSRNGKKLEWNGAPVVLVGFSSMGAVTGLNFNIPGYLQVLQDHGVNFTRIWAVEQWTALAFRKPGAPHESNGLTPFAGTLSTGWDLTQPNWTYYQRLKDFVDEAWDRGIVVQLTLFDRHGVLNKNEPGAFPQSPYNQANNSNGFFAPGPVNKAPADFLSFGFTGAGALHHDFVTNILNLLKLNDNVLYEVMNEPKTSDWSLANIETFHEDVSALVRSLK